MVDKVKPLKLEDSLTQVDLLPSEVDTTQDYVTAKGFSLENLDTHLIERNGDNIQFTDVASGTKTIKNLLTASQNTFDNTSNGFIASNVQSAIEEAATMQRVYSGYDLIPLLTTIIVPENQQSLVYGPITVLGSMGIEGKLIILEWT